jgi:hypothetical protein
MRCRPMRLAGTHAPFGRPLTKRGFSDYVAESGVGTGTGVGAGIISTPVREPEAGDCEGTNRSSITWPSIKPSPMTGP